MELSGPNYVSSGSYAATWTGSGSDPEAAGVLKINDTRLLSTPPSLHRSLFVASLFSVHTRLSIALRHLLVIMGPTTTPVLQDEYGQLDSSGETWVCEQFALESGAVLAPVQVKYNTYGRLNEARDNAMVVFHALTGNSNVASWWGGMLGPGRPLDTSRYFVVCMNCLGSCYGTTGPSSPYPDSHPQARPSSSPTTPGQTSGGTPYGSRFPKLTIRDTVSLTMALLQRGLGVLGVAAAVGGSMGGMQVLEAALTSVVHLRPRALVVICAGGRHTPWQVGCRPSALFAFRITTYVSCASHASAPGYAFGFATSHVLGGFQ